MIIKAINEIKDFSMEGGLLEGKMTKSFFNFKSARPGALNTENTAILNRDKFKFLL